MYVPGEVDIVQIPIHVHHQEVMWKNCLSGAGVERHVAKCTGKERIYLSKTYRRIEYRPPSRWVKPIF